MPTCALLRVVPLFLLALPFLRAQAPVPPPARWPAPEEIAALHRAQDYPAVRRLTGALVFDPATQSDLTGARLLYYRGDALLREIYRGRAQQLPEATTAIAPERASFELVYQEAGAQRLAAALADLNRAAELDLYYNGEILVPAEPGLRLAIQRACGLAAMETALFVTQDPPHFGEAARALKLARKVPYISTAAFVAEADEQLWWEADAQLLTAEVLALMAQGDEPGARALSVKWRKQNHAPLRPELAVAALALAYDLVGEYERTRALLLTMAFQQVRADGGKYDPTKHAIARAAVRTHLTNLNFSLHVKPDARTPALRAGRLAGALALRGTLTAEERAFTLGVPALKSGLWVRQPLQAGQLRGLRLRLESTDPADRQAAREALAAGLKANPDDAVALALHGRTLLQAGEIEAALTALDQVIGREPMLAAIVGALGDRAAAYTKLGRIAEAANDTRLAAQLENLLGRLAAP